MDKIINDLEYLPKKPSTWLLTLSDVKGIIMESTVSCSLLFALVAGLPYCGKSTLIRKFLRAAFFKPPYDPTGQELLFDDQYNEHGLSRYGASILGHKPYDNLLWVMNTRSSLHKFSCSSTILHDSLLQGQKVELTDVAVIKQKSFENQLLSDHMTRVYTDINGTLQKADSNLELKRIMSAGIAFVNICDTGFSKGILEFLTLICQYGRNRLNYVCMSIDDVEHLNELPNLDYPRYENLKSSVLQVGSRLSYIVRCAVAMHSGCPCSSDVSTTHHLSFIITAERALTEEEKDKAKKTLQRALDKEAVLPFLSSYNVLILDSKSQGLAEWKSDFENAIKQQSPTKENIKMSWIFLRSALFYSDRMLIHSDELKQMAAELKIGLDDELTKFLETFTKFASIFYFPKIEPLQNVVILQPEKFVNSLSNIFNCDSQFNGIFTPEKIQELLVLLPHEVVEVITSTLCFLGLATKTTTDKVDHRPSPVVSSPVVFVPLARPGAFSWQTSTDSLFIVYSGLTPPDVQGLFASELLKLEHVSLVSTEEINVTKYSYNYGHQGDCIFSLNFQSTRIEVLIEHYRDIAEMFDGILQCCMKALNKLKKIFKGFSYYFALQCLKPHELTESEGIKKNIEYERLPKQDLCNHCEKSKKPLRKKWNEAVQKYATDTEKLEAEVGDKETDSKCIQCDYWTETGDYVGKNAEFEVFLNIFLLAAVMVLFILAFYGLSHWTSLPAHCSRDTIQAAGGLNVSHLRDLLTNLQNNYPEDAEICLKLVVSDDKDSFEIHSQSSIYMAGDMTGTFYLHGNSAQSLNWEQYGFILHSPQGVVSKRCAVAVTPLVGGDFVFPEGTVLVSAVYTVSVNKPLLKPLTIELQHCVNLRTAGQTKYLKFVRASLNSKPPYQFEIVEGGVFSVGSRYGSVESDKFSWLAIVSVMNNELEGEQEGNDSIESNGGTSQNSESDSDSYEPAAKERGASTDDTVNSSLLNSDQQECSLEHNAEKGAKASTNANGRKSNTSDTVALNDMVYTGAIYYEPKDDRWLCIFTIVKDLNALTEYIDKCYKKAEKDAKTYGLQFVSRSVQLNLTEAYRPAGWDIIPHQDPVKLYQDDINKFKSPDLDCDEPPHCLLSVYPVDEPDPVKRLNYKIPLIGVSQRGNPNVSVVIVRSHKIPIIQHDKAANILSGKNGKAAVSVLTKNKAKLDDVISKSEPVLRDIITACESQDLLTSREARDILDPTKGESLQARAAQLTQLVQNTVEYSPDDLDVFLKILEEKGNRPVKIVARDIASIYAIKVNAH